MRDRNKRQRPYQIKKTGIRDENIDRQILAIHRAIVDKLLLNPHLLEQVKAQLEERKALGRLPYSQYITWYSIVDSFANPEIFQQAVLEDSPKMRKYRRNTPFVNILTEPERQHALYQSALGEVPDILTIVY